MEQRIIEILNEVARQYPSELIAKEQMDIKRITFNISLSLRLGSAPLSDGYCKSFEVCDIGGGVGLFSVGCAALGVKRSVLIDDFNDAINHQMGPTILDLHRSYGVEVASRDVIAAGILDIDGSFDAITSFDSMEHWHNSPKALFTQVVAKLKPGGRFILGVPNCVNLRKRLTVPLGSGKWSSMADWYEESIFRGHVREPDVDDLLYIARDMGLVGVRVKGRNWVGIASPRLPIRITTRLIDYPLRLMPTFCADLYLIGHKPQ
jgi:2-polyprenyl-3-methyl-5-hydroxy-6-metoxy-1,4-benzoquinol methylase